MKYHEVLNSSPLFKGIERGDLEVMLDCLSAKQYGYKKNSFIILAGDTIRRIGIVLSGKLAVIKEDMDGNASIITELSAGEILGEAYACAGMVKSTVSVQASANSIIMFLDYRRTIASCPSSCTFHTKIIENMLAIMANKVLMLNQKLEIVSKRTTREKLLTYLEMQRKKAGTDKFAIPYNREQLAGFLFIDRSSMSRELCKMRDEGLIRFNKNEFEFIL